MFEIGLTELKSRCWQGCVLLKDLGENLLPCHFQLPEANCPLWLMVLSFIFKASSKASSSLFMALIPASIITSLALFSFLFFFFFSFF